MSDTLYDDLYSQLQAAECGTVSIEELERRLAETESMLQRLRKQVADKEDGLERINEALRPVVEQIRANMRLKLPLQSQQGFSAFGREAEAWLQEQTRLEEAFHAVSGSPVKRLVKKAKRWLSALFHLDATRAAVRRNALTLTYLKQKTDALTAWVQQGITELQENLDIQQGLNERFLFSELHAIEMTRGFHEITTDRGYMLKQDILRLDAQLQRLQLLLERETYLLANSMTDEKAQDMLGRLMTREQEVGVLLSRIERTVASGISGGAEAVQDVNAAGNAYRLLRGRRGHRPYSNAYISQYAFMLKKYAPIVQLWCGSGDFLDLCRQVGVPAQGVEPSETLAAVCRERGHEVARADCLSYLEDQEDGAWGAVFVGLPVALPPSGLCALFARVLRVLRPQGRLIVESADPTSFAGLQQVLQLSAQPLFLSPQLLLDTANSSGFTRACIHRSPLAQADVFALDPLPEGASAEARHLLSRLMTANERLGKHARFALIADK